MTDRRVAETHELPIERAGRADADALLALINHIQPHVPWDRAQLDWQFFEPPSGEARLYVLRDHGRIVALYAAIPQQLRTGDRLVATWMVQDVMTHPEYRGRGFLHRLGEQCLADIRADAATGYTFPNKLSEGSFRRLPWTEHGLVPRRTAAVHDPAVGSADLAEIAPLSAAFDDRDTRAWENAGVTGVHRDAAFLEWRYRKPHIAYERYRVGGDQGFLVLKQYVGEDGAVLHICDLVVRSDARELVAAALAFAHDRAARTGASRLTAWLPADHPHAPAFERAGLHLDTDHDRYMFVTGMGSEGMWHVTQGDSDVY